ncbi:MAG TPA: hypothetical protein DCE41_04565, partial [Cytophagales bacterium]|nr:hypothetical protein [Cytophagales bacterium]
LLVNPGGEQFISLTRDASRTQEDATLPTQWAVHEHTLTDTLQLDLFGVVEVYRADNGDSFQGPLPADFDIEDYTDL